MRTLCILLLSIITMSQISAQAWTKAKGKSFLKLDFTSLTGNKVFADNSEIIDFQDYSFNTISFYGEYGINDRLTVVSYVPFLQSNTLQESPLGSAASNTGFGDVDIAFRYAVFKNRFPLSLTLLLGIPTGEYTDANELFTGDGEFNQMIKIASGLGTSRWWLQGGIGFNNRTENFSDEIRYDAEFGYKFLNNKLLTMLKLGGVAPLDNGTAATTRTGLFSNNVAYLAPALEIMYYIKPHVGVLLRGAGAGSGARNVQATPSLSFGAFYEN